jgi:hypothetical protein
MNVKYNVNNIGVLTNTQKDKTQGKTKQNQIKSHRNSE